MSDDLMPFDLERIRISELERENAALREVLQKAADMISSEYCSHGVGCSATNERCYAKFIYEALK